MKTSQDSLKEGQFSKLNLKNMTFSSYHGRTQQFTISIYYSTCSLIEFIEKAFSTPFVVGCSVAPGMVLFIGRAVSPVAGPNFSRLDGVPMIKNCFSKATLSTTIRQHN